MRNLILFLALLALSACAGDPLRDVPKLQDVDVVDPAAPVVEAVAAPAETDANTGFFQRLLRKRQVGDTSGQNDPSPDATTDSAPVDQPAQGEAKVLTEGAPSDAAPETQDTPRKRGLWLFGRKNTATGTPPAEETQAAAQTEPNAKSQNPAPESAETVAVAAAPVDESAGAARVEPQKRGLFGIGRKREPAAPETLQKAALSDPGAAVTPQTEARARGGLFSRKKAARLTGPDARVVQPGESVPFGEIARACHVKRAQLGKEVAKYPERGAKYRVYDSAPGNVGLHTFYVTGFKDGCPRQVTAALAVFGTAGMYETLRYNLPPKARTKKPTDKAYEKVKSRTCGVSKSKPCGAKIAKMEKNTVFLSLYNRFEGAQGWTNLLFSDGKVMAKDVQG